jgi:ribosomal 50S subunit-recycling heat shock protein
MNKSSDDVESGDCITLNMHAAQTLLRIKDQTRSKSADKKERSCCQTNLPNNQRSKSLQLME